MPNDLWSRFTHQLELKNPTSDHGYSAMMFLYWHAIEVAKALGSSCLVDLIGTSSSGTDAKDRQEDIAINKLKRQVARVLLFGSVADAEHIKDDEPMSFLSGSPIEKIARRFEDGDNCSARGQSVRAVRQAAKAASGVLLRNVLESVGSMKDTEKLSITKDMEDRAIEEASDTFKILEYGKKKQ